MKKLYFVILGKHRKVKNPKTSYILEKNISSFYSLQEVQEWWWKNIYRWRINWDNKDSLFNWKDTIALRYVWRKHKPRI